MWTRLLSNLSIKEGLKSTMKDGVRVRPLISGRDKKELKNMFVTCGLPWIYDDPIIHNPSSPYNREFKTTSNDKHFHKRLEQIKKSVKLGEEKAQEYRKKRARRLIKATGVDQKSLDMLVAIGVREERKSKRKKKKAAARRAEKLGERTKRRRAVLKKYKPDPDAPKTRKEREIYNLL